MNSFGTLFRISIFGESHGPSIGIIIDGCPPGTELTPDDFIPDLSRRRSGQVGTTKRQEADVPEILSGVVNGKTTGFPITVITRNNDKISSDYNDFSSVPRPGHADFTASKKFKGFADMRGGGHFSGRITWGLVVAGVIAKKICREIKFTSTLIEVGGKTDIKAAIDEAIAENDTRGGVIECTISGLTPGLGEPFFNSFESIVSHLVFSIPAVKGIEFGAGFAATRMKGSQHNDPFLSADGKTLTNNAGGVNGGITNGNEVIFRVAVKPTSSTGVEQTTLNFVSGKMETLQVKGRHDTCIALRIPVIVEAAAAIATADLKLVNRGIYGS